MEFFFFIMIILAIVGICFSTFAFFETSTLRSNEAKNVDEIARLRDQISGKRDKIQAIRLGDYKPTATEKQRYTKDHHSHTSSTDTNFVRCFYCDEQFEREALVCCHCARPVFANTQKFRERLRFRKNKT